jgi:hypothetical protein
MFPHVFSRKYGPQSLGNMTVVFVGRISTGDRLGVRQVNKDLGMFQA